MTCPMEQVKDGWPFVLPRYLQFDYAAFRNLGTDKALC
jgi:hypothetical protein